MSGEAFRVDTIISGKFRRYANITLAQQLRYHLFKTHLMNVVDLFKIAAGLIQSFVKLIIWRPDVVFCKGGFVCLPVGIAAKMLRIPIVIHDSDTVPGLTNRILSRYAVKIGTGAPIENYPYPVSKMIFVGIPVRSDIRKFNGKEKEQAKMDLGFDPSKKLLLAVGGGGGASNLNWMVAKIVEQILKQDWQILMLTGRNKSSEIKSIQPEQPGFKIVEFMTDGMDGAIGAADIAITRSGATAVAEFATAKTPIVVVPSPHLAGDHQTKNARVYAAADAALVVDERDYDQDEDVFLRTVTRLMNDEKLQKKLGNNLSQFAIADCLDKMVDMIIEAAR